MQLLHFSLVLLCFSPRPLSSFTHYAFCSSACLLPSSLTSCLFCSPPRCWAHRRYSIKIYGMETAHNSSYLSSTYNVPGSTFTLHIHSLIYPHKHLPPILQMCKLRLRAIKKLAPSTHLVNGRAGIQNLRSGICNCYCWVPSGDGFSISKNRGYVRRVCVFTSLLLCAHTHSSENKFQQLHVQIQRADLQIQSGSVG